MFFPSSKVTKTPKYNLCKLSSLTKNMLTTTKTRRSCRRVKWHTTPPPPSPKIINLPRRHTTRRRKPRTTVSITPAATVGEVVRSKGKLGSLFGVERSVPSIVVLNAERRERVEAEEVVVVEEGGGGGGLEEERWKFQAEILRAECNFLRMERKLALKKLEKNRVRIERTLQSALQNLANGRKKLCEGKNMEVVLEEEMRELAEKLEELQSSYNGRKDRELLKCKNFDKKALCLQRRLEKLGGLTDDEFAEVNEDGVTLTCKSQTKSNDVDMLERKMEGLSKGMLLDRMEKEYGSIINSSVASSASTSKRIDFPDHLSFSNRFSNQVKEPLVSQETNNRCSGRCKTLVRKIVEQVRAETEQWSQMQDMLGKLREEMEELQTSKDFWETQALASNQEIKTLMSNVEEWREKAIAYETKANELQTEVSLVKGELEKLKKDQVKEVASTPKKTIVSLSKQIERETKNGSSCRMNKQEKVEQSRKDSHPLSLGKQLAREKRILISRLKENRPNGNEISSEGRRKGVRSPFKDIGNSSSSAGSIRQSSNAIFPLHCPEPAGMED